jgi:fimbrial chaperone protein
VTPSLQPSTFDARLKATERGRAGRAFVFLCLLACTAAQAGTFVVSPVRATLSASQQVGALTVRNDGTEPTVVQLEVLSWSQQDTRNVYEPTREILATPPIFTLSPGGSQIVRVGLRRAPDPQRELSYRLYLQEVPPPPKPDFQGLQVALRIGVPVFVLPPAPAKPVLRWQLSRTPQGQLKLTLSNGGNAHIQVANFRLVPAGGEPLPTLQAAAYVLPGQSRDWLVEAGPAPPPGSALRLFAQTDAGDIQAELVVEQP